MQDVVLDVLGFLDLDLALEFESFLVDLLVAEVEFSEFFHLFESFYGVII